MNKLLRHYARWFKATSSLLLLASMLILPLESLAENISVVFPQLPPPYDVVFEQIIDGLSADKTLKVFPYPVDENFSASDLEKGLITNRIDGLVCLGKRGVLALNEINQSIPTVIGALPFIPEGSSGISLAADPQKLFKELRNLAPSSKRISVVYSPQSAWLIDLAKKEAPLYGFELTAFATETLRDAMHKYREIINASQSRKDAIWLPMDSVTVNTEVVVPMLLKEAWDRDIILFSSNPVHVQRGTLFSLSPDYPGLGQELGNLIKQKLNNPELKIIAPTNELRMAVNVRTAAHLGLSFSARQQQQFDMTFPSR